MFLRRIGIGENLVTILIVKVVLTTGACCDALNPRGRQVTRGLSLQKWRPKAGYQ